MIIINKATKITKTSVQKYMQSNNNNKNKRTKIYAKQNKKITCTDNTNVHVLQ